MPPLCTLLCVLWCAPLPLLPYLYPACGLAAGLQQAAQWPAQGREQRVREQSRAHGISTAAPRPAICRARILPGTAAEAKSNSSFPTHRGTGVLAGLLWHDRGHSGGDANGFALGRCAGGRHHLRGWPRLVGGPAGWSPRGLPGDGWRQLEAFAVQPHPPPVARAAPGQQCTAATEEDARHAAHCRRNGDAANTSSRARRLLLLHASTVATRGRSWRGARVGAVPGWVWGGAGQSQGQPWRRGLPWRGHC